MTFPGRVERLAAMMADRAGERAVGEVARGETEQLLARARHDAELRVSEGGHAFFVQDRAALPEILDFLAG